MPTRWRSPFIGYLIAVLSQTLAALLTVLIMHIFPTIKVLGLLEIQTIVLVALGWGAGPSLLATLLGAIFLDVFLLPPYNSWMITGTTTSFTFIFFLSIGLSISLFTSRVNSARRLAAQFASSLTLEQESLNKVIENIPDMVIIYDQTGKLIQLNRAAQTLMPADRGNETLPEALEIYNIRSTTGEPIPLSEIPVARALRGQTVSGV